MIRHDLLALNDDDLAALKNRGIVKRARKELDKFTVRWEESTDGSLTAFWSDKQTCTLLAGVPLNKGECSCSVNGLCLHLIRTALAYQQRPLPKRPLPTAVTTDKELPTEQTIHEPVAGPATPWDPGLILEEQLQSHYGRALSRLQRQFDKGLLFELVRSSKPTAHIRSLGCTVRFLVPGDFRYNRCDCQEEMPCSHVPLAIWAFRQLPETELSGLTESNPQPQAVNRMIIEKIARLINDFLELGISNAPPSLRERWLRETAVVAKAGLIWPASVMEEIALLMQQYHERDARFDPVELAKLFGELLIRLHSLQSGTPGVPDLFVRGSKQDGATRIGKSRLNGIGCGAYFHKGAVTLTTFLQDEATGMMTALQKDFVDPKEGKPAVPLFQLAKKEPLKTINFSRAGSHNILVQGGRRLGSGLYKSGQRIISSAAVTAPSEQWESLHPPLLNEDFSELAARQAVRPPTALSPRRLGERLAVVPLEKIDQPIFNSVTQRVEATLHDLSGRSLLLSHPYHNQAAAGCETLLNYLRQHGEQASFVAGELQNSDRGFIFQPLSLQFVIDGRIKLLQPWIDEAPTNQTSKMHGVNQRTSTKVDPIHRYPIQLLDLAGSILVTGLEQSDRRTAASWENLAQTGFQLGFDRLPQPVAAFARLLDRRASQLDWRWQDAVPLFTHILRLARFAAEHT